MFQDRDRTMANGGIHRSEPISLVPPLASTVRPDAGPDTRRPSERHRTVFLSDMHLGARMCRPELILAFLDAHHADTVYLVGDIVDNWQPLSRNWPQAHHAVLRRLLDLPQTGCRVVYLPGNHDGFFAQYAGTTFGGIEVEREAIHQTADGYRLLVTHGDQCDVFARRAPVMARLGSLIETGARALDAGQRAIGAAAGLPRWDGLTRRIAGTKGAIRRHDRFEDRLCDLADARGVDGIVCGHFHQPALNDWRGLIYANCGDWTEHGTGLVEGFDGQLRLLAVVGDTLASPVPANSAAPEDGNSWAV